MNENKEVADLRESLEDLQREYYKNAAWYFSRKDTPEGVYGSIGNISTQLEKLNKNLEASSKSSDKLSKALHWLTVWGVVVATATLCFEVYKYYNS